MSLTLVAPPTRLAGLARPGEPDWPGRPGWSGPGQPGRTGPAGPLHRLSEREREVLELMAEGRSNLGICRRLFLSPKTVESHVRSILLRLDIAPEPEDHRRVRAVLAYLQPPTGAA